MSRYATVLLAILLLVLPAALQAEPDAESPSDMASRIVARLARALVDPDRGVRYAAVMALGKAGADPAVIATRLRDPAWCVRREAGWWLRRSGAASCPFAEAVLVDGTDEERATAAWTLSGCGDAAVPALGVALDDTVEEVRLEALAALRRLGPGAHPVADKVRSRLDAESQDERYEAALTSVIIAPDACADAVRVIHERLEGMERASWEGVAALVRAGEAGRGALDDLASNDPDRRIDLIRTNAEFVEIGPSTGPRPGRAAGYARPRTEHRPRVRPPVEPESLRFLGSGDVRERLRAALDLGAAGANAANLAHLLEDPQRDVRIAAALALGSAGGDAAVPLERALRDPNPRVRRAAILSLGRQGAAGVQVAPFLADENLAISDAAFRVLRRGGPDAAEPVAHTLATGSYAAARYAPFIFEALGSRGAKATATLAGLLDADDVNVREAAARCLYHIGSADGAAAPALAAALGDERLCVVANAALALGATGLREETLRALDDPRARVRAYAALAAGWALGAARGVDQAPFEMRLPVLDVGRDAQAPTLGEIDALGDADHAEKVPVLRRGLWSSDPHVALRSAAGLLYTDLDEIESERAMEVLLPEGQRIGCGVDFDELRSIIGSSELPACLMYVTRARRTSPPRSSVFGNFHRIARADEIPALLWFERNEEPEALQGSGELHQPLSYSDRYPRIQAAFVAGSDPGPEEADALRALLRHKLDTDEPGLWPPELWILNRFEPEEEDAELLLAVARTLEAPGDEGKRAAVIRALGRLDDAATEAFLQESAKSEFEAPNATAALSRRGDAAATAQLVELSRTSQEALGLLVEYHPRLAVDVLVERLGDVEEAQRCLDLFDYADEMYCATYLGTWWPEDVFLGLEPALAADPPSPAVLGRIAVEVPLCRTRRLAALLFDALSPDRPPVWWHIPDPDEDEDEAYSIGDPDRIVALLFSVDAGRTRTLLRGWAELPTLNIRDWARSALVQAGDPESAEALLTWDDAAADTPVLARSDSPAVRAWLRAQATEGEREWDRIEAVKTLARLLGWPAHVPFQGPGGDESPPDSQVRAVLEGDLPAALLAARWTRWLEDLTTDPGGAPVWARLGQRALGGDKVARAAFWSALRAGRYRWVHYNFDGILHTLGCDAETLPHWVADLDSNCCRISDGLACDGFGNLYLEPVGWNAQCLYDTASHDVGRPPSQRVLDLFRLTGGAWVWSPILDGYGVGLDDATRTTRIPAPE